MTNARILAALAGWLLIASTVSAQAVPARFRWQPGQTLNYRSEQVTTETEESKDGKNESTLKLTQMKRWQALAVDAEGVATLQQSLTALRIEKSNGTTTAVYDSADASQSDPEMKKQLERFVNVPLATLRIDRCGRVVEVKESKQGGAPRFENELPFALVLPEQGLQADQKWERNYNITLEPPLGTGEQYAAMQNYHCRQVADGMAHIALTTGMKAQPEAPADQQPLLRFQPEGEVTFDLKLGLLRKARLAVDKELKNHQGAGSSYRMQATYTEEYIGNQ